jgi:branched-subunit amino acid ABC-type transport system permease component
MWDDHDRRHELLGPHSRSNRWPMAALGAFAVTAAASLVVESFTWRWLRGAHHFVPLVSSMVFLLLFEHLAIANWGSDMHVVPSPSAVRTGGSPGS